MIISPSGAPATKSNVSYIRDDYAAASIIWERTRAACDGEDHVKSIPGILPYMNAKDISPDNIKRNETYLTRAVYFNASGRTLEGLIGLAFARDPDVNLGKFGYLADNADGTGVSLYHCAQQTLSGILQTGRHGLLTDMINGRPGIVNYPAESIINWRVENNNGIKRLVLLVLRELVNEPDGDYGMRMIDQYREYRIVDNKVVLRIWRDEKGNNNPQVYDTPKLSRPNANKMDWEEIPFAFVGSQSNSPTIQPAPLKGLADMNLAHFRDSADYQDSVFFCGQVQAWMTGLDTEWRDWLEQKGMYVGSRTPLMLPQGSQFGFAQAQPNMLAKEAMDGKQAAMVALGARVVEENKVTKTATQAAGDIATGTSVLGLCCSNISEAVTRCLQWCGEFDRATSFSAAKFRVTQDFSNNLLSPQDLTALVSAWQAGAFSRVDLRVKLKSGGIIAPERTDAQIDEEISQETPLIDTQPILPNAGPA